MPPTSPDVRDLLHERLDTLFDEGSQVMDAADYGQTIHDLDDFMLIAEKKFLQEIMQQKLQERIEQAEQKAEQKQCPQCDSRTAKFKIGCHFDPLSTSRQAPGEISQNRRSRNFRPFRRE